MMTKQKTGWAGGEGGGGLLEICHMFVHSIVFEQLIYSSFLQTAEVRVRKLMIFMGCHK